MLSLLILSYGPMIRIDPTDPILKSNDTTDPTIVLIP